MTILSSAWALQHRIEAWYHKPRVHKQSTITPEVSLDIALVVGTCLVAYGFQADYIWWIFGGTLIICLAVIS
jgi:hypothetical protein